MQPTTVTPRRAWYVLAMMLVVAGVLAVPAAFLLPLLGLRTPTPFLVPGSRAFDLAASGKYVLWHETQTIFQGKTYSGGTLPGGLEMHLSNVTTHAEVPLIPDQSTTMTSGGSSRRSIATFTVVSPGKHLLTVRGQSPPMVFSFGKSEWGNVLKSAGIGLLLCPSLIIVGLVLGGCVFVRRHNRSKALRP